MWDDLDMFLTTTQVAQMKGVSRQAVNKAILAGRLPATRIGDRTWVIRVDDAQHYIKGGGKPES